MPRSILAEDHLHPAIRDKVASHKADIVAEVQQAAAQHPVLVVGMKQNPHPRRARKALDAKGIAYHYLEYGSYFGVWGPRLALKMWTGWSTFPMVFVHGVLIGGADEVVKLIESGELERMISAG